VTAVASYADQMKALLVSQFAGAANLHALLAALAQLPQELETVFQRLRYLRSISLADGVQLDALGELLSEPRAGRQDVEYRAVLRYATMRNACTCTPNDLIRYVQALSGQNDVEYIETPPASFEIVNNGTLVLDLPQRIRAVIPAGVGPVSVTQTSGTVVV
jgi:hypothetical protein